MLLPPLPTNEADRLRELQSYDILDTLPERVYDGIVALTSHICGTPISLVSLVDGERQWFKARVGLEASETAREVAFCAHAILQLDRPLVVEDTRRDTRFADNPLVTGEPRVGFYAGAPLVAPGGVSLGTLCVIDHEPRTLTPAQTDALMALSRQVVEHFVLRRNVHSLENAVLQYETYREEMEACINAGRPRSGRAPRSQPATRRRAWGASPVSSTCWTKNSAGRRDGARPSPCCAWRWTGMQHTARNWGLRSPTGHCARWRDY